MDKKVSRPANVFAYVFGSIGAIIMAIAVAQGKKYRTRTHKE